MKNFRPFSSATRLLFCAICLALLSPSPASAQSADDYLNQAREAEYGSKEQFDLYMKAAELGNAEAQCSVGVRYECSVGVAEDCYEAFKWYKKSADQGYAKGIYNVGGVFISPRNSNHCPLHGNCSSSGICLEIQRAKVFISHDLLLFS